MAYEVVMSYHLHMPSYFLGTFTEYPALLFNLWSWRESNPRPNEEIISFLHAYLCLIFRATAEPKLSTVALSSKVSSEPRGWHELSPI